MKPKIFLHNQRCGGTTLRTTYKIYGIASGPFRIIPSERYDRVLNKINTVIESDPESSFMFEIEPGVYLDTVEDEFDFFTIIRDPVDRVLSLIELRSRPDDPQNVNIFRCSSYDFRKTEQFWLDAKDHIEKSSGGITWHYSNTYVHSLSGTQEYDFDLAMSRIKAMPVLVYNKPTYGDDLVHFMETIGAGDYYKNNMQVTMKGSVEFLQSAPLWFREFLADINSDDIALFEEISSRINKRNHIIV